jgi:hypothetical protein
MDIRFISLGFYEKFDFDNQTSYSGDLRRIKNYFGNTLFHFKMNFNNSENQIININGGFYDPINAETNFYYNETITNDDYIIIERQPDFYAFLIPYPILNIKFPNDLSPGEDWAFNPKPFNEASYLKDDSRKKRFSNSSLKYDMRGAITINNDCLWRYTYHNNFFDNNCYPIFVSNIEELEILIVGLRNFYKAIFGFSINKDNLSKIIIPFFELSKPEATELSKAFYF